MSDRVRRELREDASEITDREISVGRSMTESLEAYSHYVRGLELAGQYGELAAASAEWREALAIDPGFGAAHLMLGRSTVYRTVSDFREHREAARALADRMPEKEREMILLYGPAPPDEIERRAAEILA